MKRFAFALMASVVTLPSFAQNLVPNPSFEEYLECPFSTAALDNELLHWFSWQESPDFFHTCSNELDGFAGVPNNAWGHQLPIQGSGYSGLFTYVDYDENNREYMAAQLVEPLSIGESYYLMFHVSFCDSSELINRKCATNNLGMRFFKDPAFSYFPPVNAIQADNFAHLNSDEIISDDQNWTLIDGWFTADETYNWLAIGNFFDDQNTATLELNDEQFCSAIYYVENVCVAINPADCDYLLSNPVRPTSTEHVSVFPNPAINEITIKMGDGHIQTLVLFDALGKELVHFKDLRQATMSLDISGFQKGVYVLRIKSQDQIFNQKVIFK